MTLHESAVEEAALPWFGELGHAIGHGPRLVLGEHVEDFLTLGPLASVENRNNSAFLTNKINIRL